MSGEPLPALESLQTSGVIAAVDYQFAQFVGRFDADPVVIATAAMASQALGQQHTCVSLAQRCLAGEMIPASAIAPPTLAHWQKLLRGSSVVGEPGETCPLIMDGDTLYLSRYFDAETEIAAALRQRSQSIAVDEQWLAQRLTHYFGTAGAEPDWQKLAAAIALSRSFALIAGGPGTGKTTTVVKILALLLEQQGTGKKNIRVRMAAPTGKAAARLAQSIGYALQNDKSIDPALAAAMPTEVRTIHRLLRPLPNSNRFRHHRENPLDCDVLLVDEVSMIDMGLMTQLLAALKPDARLILLGDRDQLPSVGVGQILKDLCASIESENAENAPPYSAIQRGFLERVSGAALSSGVSQSPHASIDDSIVLLQRSYRFAPDSGIGQFARAVNAGDATAARQMLDGATRGEFGDLTALDLSQAGDWRDRLAQPYEEMLRRFADPELGPQHKLDILDEYRVLCALREGSAGVNRINNAIESHLAHCGLVIPGQVNYAGRPIMVVENNYALQLYNGDNGVILHDATGQLAAFFTTVDGHVRQIAIGRLPRYECSYAISVHKSQGSEYRHVALVLPSADGGEMNPLITRELIYTAVTRAREELTLACNVDVMCAGLRRRVQRQSGLAARLREVG